MSRIGKTGLRANIAGGQGRVVGGLRPSTVGTDAKGIVVFDRPTVLAFLGAHYHFMRDVVSIPFEIHELASGDAARVASVARDIVGFQRATFGGLALGVWMSVECSEEAPAMRDRIARGERPESEWVPSILAACRTWPHGEVPPDFHDAVHSNAPVLVLASPMEPSYPAELARRVAAGFSHVRIVVDANHGHVFDDDWQMCLGPQAIAFLDTLDLNAVDPRCAARFQFRPFKLPKPS